MNLEDKLKNSVDCENGLVFFSDRRIVDFDGNLVGFFDTEYSMSFGERLGLAVGEEKEYVSVRDFKDIEDFKFEIKRFCKGRK